LSTFDEWKASFYNLIDESLNLKMRLSKADLAVNDARYIKKIIHQLGQAGHLPVDDFARPLRLEIRWFNPLHDVKSASNGRERIAELMAKHGQKLVLAFVSIAQRFL